MLGCGATGAALVAAGVEVTACILCADVTARANRPALPDLRDDTRRAQETLGFGEPFLGAFPNIALNTVPHLELVQFIENAVVESRASLIFTHHGRDLNNDHLQVSLACQAAAQMWRRRDGVQRVTSLLLMETLSSTDWSLPDGRSGFEPNTFMPVSEEALRKKLDALLCYRGVPRERPHSRSAEIIRAAAAVRGAQCGAQWAEAFQSAFRILSPSAD